jgi:hypothetical protein
LPWSGKLRSRIAIRQNKTAKKPPRVTNVIAAEMAQVARINFDGEGVGDSRALLTLAPQRLQKLNSRVSSFAQVWQYMYLAS